MYSGNFIWAESLEKPVYTNWRNGEPNNGVGHVPDPEDCTTKIAFNGWGDYNCDWDTYHGKHFYALCEI